MKRIIVMLLVVAFTGTMFAEGSPVLPHQDAKGKTAPRVPADNGKGKDNGKHIGKEEHHHNHGHHKGEGKK